MLNTAIGKITLGDLLFLIFLFAGTGWGAWKMMTHRGPRKLAVRSILSWGVYVVLYLTVSTALGTTPGLIVTGMYLTYMLGNMVGYHHGRSDEQMEPEALARMIEARLARDWPAIVTAHAAQAARDN